MLDADAEAGWLLRDFDARHPPGARAVVRHHLGADAIIRVSGLIGAPAELAMVHGEFRIALRQRIGPEAERWFLLHELGEWRLKQLDYREDDIELVAEAIAAALVLPREAYRIELREHGRHFRSLARAFLTPETAAALRLGEVTGEPVAVIAPARIRVRGDEDWVWPPEEQLRWIAAARQMPPGVRRVVLTDDRRRRVLMVG